MVPFENLNCCTCGTNLKNENHNLVLFWLLFFCMLISVKWLNRCLWHFSGSFLMLRLLNRNLFLWCFLGCFTYLRHFIKISRFRHLFSKIVWLWYFLGTFQKSTMLYEVLQLYYLWVFWCFLYFSVLFGSFISETHKILRFWYFLLYHKIFLIKCFYNDFQKNCMTLVLF